ncbi:MAG TPA: alpha/beta hydrolase [Clostridiales bacterium]|nr:alpha/beta hydrolase [Clostridiales bacterium]
MINEQYSLWTKEEYTYPVLGEFSPNIVTYIHDEDEKIRPAILVVPGGGYCVVSNTEGEIVAKKFYLKGYNAFVVTYTTNLLMDKPLKLQPLKDVSRAVVFVRKRAQQFHIHPDKLAICGFSAGGHLCGSLAVHFDAKELVEEGEYAGISNRPDGVILSYPVISSGEHAHRDSFIALLGKEATKEELGYMSLEAQVTADTPPTFLWHTATDKDVPVENSYLFANACKEKGVDFELHIFGNGDHGLSLANEEWASGNFDGAYTMQQFFETLQFLVDNNQELPAPFNGMGKISAGTDVKELFIQGVKKLPGRQPDKGIAIWPQLVHNWLAKVLDL